MKERILDENGNTESYVLRNEYGETRTFKPAYLQQQQERQREQQYTRLKKTWRT